MASDVTDEQCTVLLGIDLDLRQTGKKHLLIEVLTASFPILNVETPGLLSFSLSYDENEDIQAPISRLYELVKGFDAEVRRSWSACESREINIGVRGSIDCQQATFGISSHSLALLSEIGADIVVTIYSA